MKYIMVNGCLFPENYPASCMMSDTDHLLPNHTTSHRRRPISSHINTHTHTHTLLSKQQESIRKKC